MKQSKKNVKLPKEWCDIGYKVKSANKKYGKAVKKAVKVKQI